MQNVIEAPEVTLANHGARLTSVERDLERLIARLDQILVAALVGAGGAVGALVLYVFSLLKH